MKQLLLGLLIVGLLAGAVAWSANAPTARPEFDFATEKVNPKTESKLNNDPNSFQFVIVSDRTGGQRARIFSQAVEQINLLQPEFVLSVGDLINGYTKDKDKVNAEWKEFQTYVSRLKMPFFYVPGNHDITNDVMLEIWKDKFGRSYYEFVYKDVLFLCLNSEDPPGKGYSNISKEQLTWLKDVLDKHKEVRWTLAFLHKPMWIQNDVDKNGWGEVEKLLAGRNYTVFAGHVHRYQKFTRQGMNYYMLATTGGGSKLRGPDLGEFDHLVWVTMKKDGPVLANILLDGIHRENLAPIITDEEGQPIYMRRPTIPVEAVVTLDGKPVDGADVVFTSTSTERGSDRADGRTDAKGVVKLSTYKAYDGVPAGQYTVTVTRRRPFFTPEGKPGPNTLPEKYASVVKSELKVQVTGTSKQTFEIKLVSQPEME
ncbi:MAG: metallophosphoesterase [Gemmataceae bacterium]